MDFIGGLSPERKKYMSKKLKKQTVYDFVYLKPLEGFTVEEVTEEKRNVVMKFVNHQTGATTRIYIDPVLFGSEMMKYTEE